MTKRDSLGRAGDTTQYLAERIRTARRTAGMSQSDLAKALLAIHGQQGRPRKLERLQCKSLRNGHRPR